MPVFVEDPSQFSKLRLKSELVAHNVALPDAESRKDIYVDLYLKHIGQKSAADFSSDEEEDQGQDVGEEKAKKEDPEMLDPRWLTDDELKAVLLKYGVKSGPVVASTRALYERKLLRLLQPSSQPSLNGTAEAEYSDSEEEEEGEEEESGSLQAGPETVRTDSQKVRKQPGPWKINPRRNARNVVEARAAWGPAPPAPPPGPGRTSSLDQPTGAPWIESRSPLSSRAERERSGSDVLGPWQRSHGELAADILTEMFPETERTPTGIVATCRRPIKGAAGRPVQFKYPDTIPFSPATLERQELGRRLVPLWVQVAVFVVIACLLYLLHACAEGGGWDSPLVSLLESLSLDSEEGGAGAEALLQPESTDAPATDGLPRWEEA